MWVLGGNISSKVLNFITLGFLARVLNPGNLGHLNAVQNVANSINMMGSLGTQLVIQRISARLNEVGPKVVSEICSAAIFIYLFVNSILALSIFLLPDYFFRILLDSKGELVFINYLAILIVLNAINQVPLYLMLGLEEFKKYSALTLFINLITLISALGFVFVYANNLTAAFISTIVASVVNMMATLFIFYKLMKRNQLGITVAIKYKTVKEIFKQGFVYYLGNTFFVAVAGLVTVSLFYKYLTPVDYGYLRIGNALAVLFTIIPATLQPITVTFLSWNNEGQDYLKSLQLRIIPFLSSLLLIFLLLNLELVIRVFFGPSYSGAWNVVFGILLLQIFTTYLSLINAYHVGHGNLNFIGYVSIITCLFLLAASFILVPQYGIVGYFIALYAANFLSLSLVFFKEIQRKNWFKREDVITIIIIGLSILVSSIMAFWAAPLIKFLFSIMILSFSAFLFWKSSLSNWERELFLSEARKPKKLRWRLKKKYEETPVS